VTANTEVVCEIGLHSQSLKYLILFSFTPNPSIQVIHFSLRRIQYAENKTRHHVMALDDRSRTDMLRFSLPYEGLEIEPPYLLGNL
jgi:hypothetical protein